MCFVNYSLEQNIFQFSSLKQCIYIGIITRSYPSGLINHCSLRFAFKFYCYYNIPEGFKNSPLCGDRPDR